MIKKKKKEVKSERIAIRIKPSLKKKIELMAEKTGRGSAGELIHDILEEKLLK